MTEYELEREQYIHWAQCGQCYCTASRSLALDRCAQWQKRLANLQAREAEMTAPTPQPTLATAINSTFAAFCNVLGQMHGERDLNQPGEMPIPDSALEVPVQPRPEPERELVRIGR